MSLKGSYATDLKLEQEGRIFTFPDMERGRPAAFRVRLSRMTGRNTKYKQVKARLMEQFGGIAYEDLPEEKQNDLGRQLFCEAIIVSFETQRGDEHTFDSNLVPLSSDGYLQGVECVDCLEVDDKITVIPATPEHLAAAFKAAPDFFTLLYSAASDADNYRLRRRERASKNS